MHEPVLTRSSVPSASVFNLFQNPFLEVKYFFFICYSNFIENNNKNKQTHRNYQKTLFYVGYPG